jgi:hypothetical protein
MEVGGDSIGRLELEKNVTNPLEFHSIISCWLQSLRFDNKMRLVVSFLMSHGKPDLNNLCVRNNISSD